MTRGGFIAGGIRIDEELSMNDACPVPSSDFAMGLQLQSCVIRPWSLDDAAAVQRYANNRGIWQNLRDAFPHPYTLEHARGFLNHVANEKPAVTFAIALPSEAIGCIGLQVGRDVHCRT